MIKPESLFWNINKNMSSNKSYKIRVVHLICNPPKAKEHIYTIVYIIIDSECFIVKQVKATNNHNSDVILSKDSYFLLRKSSLMMSDQVVSFSAPAYICSSRYEISRSLYYNVARQQKPTSCFIVASMGTKCFVI